MSEKNESRVNINTASKEELIAVPGIGPVLAERIILERPYLSLEDLARVQGINQRFIDGVREYLSVVSEESVQVDEVLESEVVEEVGPEIVDVKAQLVSEEDAHFEEISGEVEGEEMVTEVPNLVDQALEEAQSASDVDVVEVKLEGEKAPTDSSDHVEEAPLPKEASPKTPKEEKGQKPQQDKALLYSLLFSVIALVLGIIITLGILGAVNGTLAYAPSRQFNAVSQDVDTLQAQMEILDQDIVNLKTRMDALDALSGRVSDLETETKSLSADLQAAEKQLSQMDERLLQLDERTAKLEKNAETFEAFLKGLKSLMNEVVPEVPTVK